MADTKMIELDTILIPTSGWVLWSGEAWQIENLFRKILQLEPSESLKLNNQQVTEIGAASDLTIAAIFEWGGLLSNKTLMDNILLPLEYRGKLKPDSKENIYKLFLSFGYQSYLEKRPFYVPRNVQKISSIVRAFFQEPEVILAQNISFGLETSDVKHIKQFMQLYKNVNIHFSEVGFLNKEDFDVVVETKKWEKTA